MSNFKPEVNVDLKVSNYFVFYVLWPFYKIEHVLAFSEKL